MRIKDVVYVYRLVGGEKLAWHGRYHAHGADEYEFHFFIEGQGAFLSNRERIALEPGKLTLTRPREFHSILPEAVSRPITYYAVLFEPENGSADDAEALKLLERASAASGKNTHAPRGLESRDRFLFEELHRLSRADDESGKRAASFQLLSLIYRWFGDRAAGEIEGPPRNDHTEKALALMERALREKLGMEDLAAKLGLSEEHFIRLFRAELGMTPFQYYTRLKIEAACGLLSGGYLPVGRVAEYFGFENQFHFARVFKKCTGLSPTEYRRTYARV
jgi:AraC-like DNA-binding protein